MNHEKHDRKLRAKFDSYTPSVDESALWEEIESALPQPKRKKRYFILSFTVALLGCVSIIMFPIKEETPKEVNSVDSIAELNNVSIEQAGDITLNELLDNKSVKSEITSKSIKYKQKYTGINVQPQHPNKFTITIKKEKTRPESKPIHSTTEIPSIIDNKAPTRITNWNPIRNVNAVLPLPTNYKLMPLVFEKEDLEISLEHIPMQYAESELRSRWTLGVNAGAGKAISVHSNSTDRNEIGKESLAANLALNYRLSKKWSIGLGLSYQYHVSSSQVSSIALKTSIRQDTIAIIETVSNIETVEGPREFLTTTRQTHLRHQIRQQLLAPITIRYTTSLSKAWNVQFGLGYGLGLWSDYKGIIQDPLAGTYDLSTDAKNRLRPRGGDSIIVESYISRNIAAIGKLKLGVNYLHDLNGRYTNNTFNQKKSHLLQFSGGLIIPLNF